VLLDVCWHDNNTDGPPATAGQALGAEGVGLRVAKRRGMAKAMIAVARRLSVVLHRMWVDRVPFRWTDEPAQA
jgi:hypothetical protein